MGGTIVVRVFELYKEPVIAIRRERYEEVGNSTLHPHTLQFFGFPDTAIASIGHMESDGM
jgi:hypothetical protein